ncbi:hypothetical protein HZA97_04040 [Candidatus Woesearchaeota archaeon]|nr:hypothetical protein [Candidatus Woesearchaeota archaeon]
MAINNINKLEEVNPDDKFDQNLDQIIKVQEGPITSQDTTNVQKTPSKKKVTKAKDETEEVVEETIEYNYEPHNQEPSFASKVSEGLQGIPAILACTAASYFLGLTELSDKIKPYLVNNDLNFGYHLAAGSGLHAGWTRKGSRKLISLLTFTVACAPEIMLYTSQPNPDMKLIGATVGLKAVGYGAGYIVGKIFSWT